MNDEQFLEAVRGYIERSEVELDTHLGSSRKLKAMIDAGIMPPVYAEVLKRLSNPPDALVEWLEGDFRRACVNDVHRLAESIVMLKVGRDRGDNPDQCMGLAIASFVLGLIAKTTPITVPVDNN